MSLSCGIYKAPRYRNISFKEFLAIRQYLTRVENNSSLTFEQFWDDYLDECPLAYPPKEAIEFYRSKKVYEIDSWYSSGSNLHEFFANYSLNREGFDIYEIDESIIEDGLRWCVEKLKDCDDIPVIPIKAIRENDDDTTTLFPCDGVLLKDIKGSLHFGETSWENPLYIRNYSQEKYTNFNSFYVAFRVLEMIDLEDNFVWYSYSY